MFSLEASLVRFFAGLILVGLPAGACAQDGSPGDDIIGVERRGGEQHPVSMQPAVGLIGVGRLGAPAARRDITINLRDVRIAGATVYSPQELQSLIGDLRGQRVSLRAIDDVARRITAKYVGDGYILSRATIPAQKVDPRGAVVRVQVIEGYIDKVVWTHDLSRYRDFFTDYAAKITAERPANKRTIERYTLLAEDLPGIGVHTRFEQSVTVPSASTLVVEIEEKPLEAYAKGETQRIRGRQNGQVVGSATLNNSTGQHESLTLSYTGSQSATPLQFIIATFRQVLTSEGLTGFVEGSYGWGSIGTVDLELPDGVYSVTARSRAADAGLSFPVTRSHDFNLSLIGLVFLDERQSVVLPVPQIQDRLRGGRFKLDGDMIDLLKASYDYTFVVSKGIQGLGSARNGNPIASNPFGRVDFTKFEGYVSRSQSLSQDFSFKLTTYFQYALTPMQQQEQCSFGGRVLGRAFDPGGLLGDHCLQVAAELRQDLPTEGSPFSLIQPYVFVDHGTQYSIQPSPGSPRMFDATSAGAGFRLGWRDTFKVDVFGTKAIEGPTNDWRFMLFTEAKF
jgi:hemolysin activation/secretion protein